MRFRDRQDAGERLARTLGEYRDVEGTVVVALPRGGVVLGRLVADAIGAPLDLVVPRKIGAEENEEYAIGAVTESGHIVWNEQERGKARKGYLEQVIEAEKHEAQRRLSLYREGLPERDFSGKTVIVVDDGMATGLTMRAAVATVRAGSPERIIVALPVASPDSSARLREEVDGLVILHETTFFMAVGQFYDVFDQVEDEAVIELMRSANR